MALHPEGYEYSLREIRGGDILTTRKNWDIFLPWDCHWTTSIRTPAASTFGCYKILNEISEPLFSHLLRKHHNAYLFHVMKMKFVLSSEWRNIL